MLPESAQEIADVIGVNQTLKLIYSLPQAGSRSWRVCFYVPKKLRADHHLVSVLGWDDAKRLVKEFAGMILQPSNCRHIKRQLRNIDIHRLSQQNIPIQQIAALHGITDRQVRNILAEPAPECEEFKNIILD